VGHYSAEHVKETARKKGELHKKLEQERAPLQKKEGELQNLRSLVKPKGGPKSEPMDTARTTCAEKNSS